MGERKTDDASSSPTPPPPASAVITALAVSMECEEDLTLMFPLLALLKLLLEVSEDCNGGMGVTSRHVKLL
jgi:hypothetical protein